MINFDDNFTVKFIKKRKGNERETKGKLTSCSVLFELNKSQYFNELS